MRCNRPNIPEAGTTAEVRPDGGRMRTLTVVLTVSEFTQSDWQWRPVRNMLWRRFAIGYGLARRASGSGLPSPPLPPPPDFWKVARGALPPSDILPKDAIREGRA